MNTFQGDICSICEGNRRVLVKKETGNKKDPFTYISERCPICEGKGYIQLGEDDFGI